MICKFVKKYRTSKTLEASCKNSGTEKEKKRVGFNLLFGVVYYLCKINREINNILSIKNRVNTAKTSYNICKYQLKARES